MKFIKKIRENLGYSKYKMSQELGYAKDHSYTQFEDSKKAVNLEKLFGLYKLSGLTADEFMGMIEEEVTENQESTE